MSLGASGINGEGPGTGNNNEFYSLHTGGGSLVFGDGGVHFIGEDVDERAFVPFVTAGNKDVAELSKLSA